MTAYSPTSYTGDGSTTDFTVSWPYLDAEHVECYLDGVETSLFSIPTLGTIRFNTAPSASVAISIKRNTPIAPIAVWNDGAVILGADLNTAFNQSLYLSEEAEARASESIAQDASSTWWEALSKEIRDVADPTLAQSAATKAYVDANNSSTQAAAAAASAAAASTSESNAATSEANAAASAAAASTSESNSATSAANAASSEASAAASAASAGADISTQVTPLKNTSAMPMLEGEEGIAFHFPSRTFFVNEYDTSLPTNELNYSEEFDNAAWINFGSSTNPNTTTAPDGTITADNLIEDATASATHNIVQSYTWSGDQATVSVWAKANTRDWIALSVWDGTTGYSAYFDLTNGAKGSVYNGVATIEPYPNGWYRCILSFNPSNASGNVGFYLCTGDNLISYNGDGSSNLYIWGAQLEEGSNAVKPGRYVKTTSAAATATPLTNAGTPSDILDVTRASTATYVGRDRLIKTAAANELRYTHDPATGEPLGLLVEGSRTNLWTYSEQIDNAAWTPVRISKSSNTTTAPDGTSNADTITEGSSTGEIYIQQDLSVTSGDTYTLSVWAKVAAGSRYIGIRTATAVSAFVYFDLTTETANRSGGDSHSIEAYPDGWYRISLTVTAASTATMVCRLQISDTNTNSSYTGDSTSGFYVWGAQCEEGSHASSYIKTEGSTVARSADDISLDVLNNFPIDVDNLTMFVKWRIDYTPDGSSFPSAASLALDGSDRLSFYTSSGLSPTILLRDNNSGVANATSGTITPGSDIIQAASINGTDDFKADNNFGSPETDTSYTIPSLTYLQIGNLFSGASSGPTNGTISEVMVTTRAMTATELARLTG